MRGGNDEMSPMFHRLQMNDTNEGPKAPPQNKMALYEQLNVPFQRFNSGSLSMLPLPPNNNNNSLSDGDERSMLVPIHNSHESSILAEKFHSYSILRIKLNTIKGNQERNYMKATSNHSLDTTLAIPEVSKSNPLQQVKFSNLKRFSSRKLGFNDYLMVSTTPVSGIDQNCNYSQQSKGWGFSKLKLSSLMQLHIVDEKKMKGSDSVDSDSRRYAGNVFDGSGRLFQSHQNLMERPNLILSNSSIDIFNSEDDLDAWLHNIQTPEEKKCGAISRHKKARGASMVESISPFDISPDDIVGIIGEKNFWKVRRAIDNQQGAFTMQVFELHRLIKVQRLTAGSPHMLLEDTLHMAKPSLDVSSIKKSPSNYVPKQPLFLKNRLVYKPYTDPCPPTTGFLAPVYGNCGGFSNSHQ
ncbi:hypothetical protein CXB51_008380 [Gossypium anomalum]|uniref:Protein EARLY FLOWERING 3-like n=1 Tax=Gossypium anomalum TaxID=47600 RepID=A0A8J6D658_9ROSI|nr:hypothetical protein CXB51_008380 [Gossypium anomalum]